MSTALACNRITEHSARLGLLEANRSDSSKPDSTSPSSDNSDTSSPAKSSTDPDAATSPSEAETAEGSVMGQHGWLDEDFVEAGRAKRELSVIEEGQSNSVVLTTDDDAAGAVICDEADSGGEDLK